MYKPPLLPYVCDPKPPPGIEMAPEGLRTEQIAFLQACVEGNLDYADSLCKECPYIDPHAFNDLALFLACANGRQEAAEWLIDVHGAWDQDDCAGFRWACRHGHPHIVQLLSERFKQSHRVVNQGFGWSCRFGRGLTAYQLRHRADPEYLGGYALRTARANGHLGLCSWLESADEWE